MSPIPPLRPGERSPVTAQDAGVYVHFPYCGKKCPYCDFNSHVVDHNDRRYADAILAELGDRASAITGPLASLYFGGGTPSLWAPAEVARVVEAVSARFGFVPEPEITLEANPGTVSEDRFVDYRSAGITRFSIGAQSFTDAELRGLGRIHDARASHRAVQAAKASGARVSLDLMYALPGQSWDDVARSLAVAIELAPDHVSAYTLTIEPETVLGRRTRLGLFRPMEDDAQAGLIERVTATFADAGYHRYEVSSFARPGFESVHNTLYWVGGAYLGLGAGAHSYLPEAGLARGVRRENVKGPDDYLEGAAARRHPARFEETLDRAGLIGDRLMVGLRTRWGMDLAALAKEAGLEGRLEPSLEPALAQLAADGLIERSGARAWPTARGFLMNDHIARTLLFASRDARDLGPSPRVP